MDNTACDMSSKVAAPALWFEVSIPTHADRVDLVTGALAAAGISGSEVREPRSGAAEIVIYVNADSHAAAVSRAKEISARLPGVDPGDVEVRASVPDTVWTENWRSHFTPVAIGRRLRIVPPWDETRDRERVTLVINPGAAFGTGRHETTALCLEAIEDLVFPGAHVADVGCGSGVLGIAAAKLGAASVVASDIEAAAVEATRENAEANGVAEQILVTESSTPPSGQVFDLVVANIYSDTLIALAEALAACVGPAGTLVLSGIEAKRSADVERAYLAQGLQRENVRTRGEWAALVFRRP
jgi:ribosomal protein L11 methyltransferase